MKIFTKITNSVSGYFKRKPYQYHPEADPVWIEEQSGNPKSESYNVNTKMPLEERLKKIDEKYTCLREHIRYINPKA